MSSNQKGFSVVEVLVLLIVSTLFALAGWRIYGSNKNAEISNKSPETIKADKDTLTYSSAATGLNFSYPSEWGEVTETDEVKQCASFINEGNATVTGNQFSYSFTSKSNTKIVMSDDSFDIENGVLHCFADSLRLLEINSIDTDLVFERSDNKIVYAAADSCYGPVEYKYINAIRTTGSANYPRVGILHLDVEKLSDQVAEKLCADAKVTKEGLEFTPELNAFIDSIKIKQ